MAQNRHVEVLSKHVNANFIPSGHLYQLQPWKSHGVTKSQQFVLRSPRVAGLALDVRLPRANRHCRAGKAMDGAVLGAALHRVCGAALQ